MSRLKFSLSSDHLELLLAFEYSQGLNHLAEMMGRDPSVVSRNLQRITEEYPVLKKIKGRWEITPLGVQVNELTKSYLKNQTDLFSYVIESNSKNKLISLEDSVLVIINAQKGLIDSVREGRNNLEAEKNIVEILKMWRNKNRQVVHVKHVSDNPQSAFYKASLGGDFLDSVKPLYNETIVEKNSASAFNNTSLESFLNKETYLNVVLVGFTANECIEATARDSAAIGFTTFVVGDATATFDLRDPSGKLMKAERIHKLVLANINTFYAKVISTEDILKR